MPKWTQREYWEKLDANKELLKIFYQDAKNESEILWPDTAIKKLSVLMAQVMERANMTFSDVALIKPRLDPLAYARQIHHYAVDLFYDTYGGSKQIGPPRLHPEYLRQIVIMREQGLSYGKIAKKIGLPTSPPIELKKSTDKIRKQLDEAKERGITSSSKRHN